MAFGNMSDKKECKRRRQPRKVSDTVKRRIKQIRIDHDWCGQKIQKELKEDDGIRISLMTIYRVLKTDFKIGSKWKKQKVRGEAPKATAPRAVVQHDTVDFGELFAYTAIDIFSKEPSVVIAENLLSETGVKALGQQRAFYGSVRLHQSDEGPEFKGKFVETVEANGALHRYARPYRKNDQAYIENFNRSLRKECLGWGKYKKEDKAKLQLRVDQYLHHFIHERWHMGLPDMMTPA
jgi:transposase InsO family protein